MKILFVDDCNGFEGENPVCDLIEISSDITIEQLQKLEKSQMGLHRRGGQWIEIMQDGEIPYTKLSHGKLSEYKKEDYDELYKVISGNY